MEASAGDTKHAETNINNTRMLQHDDRPQNLNKTAEFILGTLAD
jgi:hypothetical protein